MAIEVREPMSRGEILEDHSGGLISQTAFFRRERRGGLISEFGKGQAESKRP